VVGIAADLPIRYRCAFLTLLTSALSSCGLPPAPDLVLEEIAAFSLPPGEYVRGAVLTLNEELVFWSRTGLWRVRDSASMDPVCAGSGSGFLWVGQVGAVLAALDTLRHQVLQIHFDAQCQATANFPLKGLIAAAATDSGWLVIQRPTTNTTPRLLFLSYQREGNPLERHLPFSVTGAASDWLYLSGSGQSVLIGNRRWPFEWAFLDARGEASGSTPKPALPGGDPNVMLTIGGDENRWMALPVLDLGGAYLQLIVDLGSDRRLFRVLDATARVLRQREVVLPLGLFFSDPRNRRLVGIRTASSPELVVYGWRWARKPERKQQ